MPLVRFDPDDVRRARDYGVDGIYCSNHGGRQANGGLASLDALPPVVEAADGMPVGIKDLLIRVLTVPESAVWVYLNGLVHTDMVEFGRVLPEPGGEQAWVDKLPADLRDELTKRGGGDQTRCR